MLVLDPTPAPNTSLLGCEPTGHAYSAAISACAAAGDWRRAVSLFDEMTGPGGIRPDVVSCTALITALAAGGEADRAEAVVGWMLANGVRPNARTYTALMAALGNAKRWGRAVEVLSRMQSTEWGGVQPNAYTYSALLKVCVGFVSAWLHVSDHMHSGHVAVGGCYICRCECALVQRNN